MRSFVSPVIGPNKLRTVTLSKGDIHLSTSLIRFGEKI